MEESHSSFDKQSLVTTVSYMVNKKSDSNLESFWL